MGRLLDEDDVVDWLLKRTEMYDATGHFVDENVVKKNIESQIAKIPSAQPEQLTDNEKRIFLAAMTREELICLQIDEKHNDPNLVNLVGMCHEITRKVKGALWI